MRVKNNGAGGSAADAGGMPAQLRRAMQDIVVLQLVLLTPISTCPAIRQPTGH